MFILRLGGLLTQESDEFVAVLRIFVDAEFEVLGELFVELGLVLFVFRDFSEHFQTPLDDVLLDDLKHLVLLQHLSGNVQWQVIRVDNALDKAQPLRDEIFTVVHDEHSSYLQFDVVFLLLAFEQVIRCSLRGEEHSFEFKLSFYGEVLD